MLEWKYIIRKAGNTLTKKEILSRTDHTKLSQDASREDIMRLCEEALKYGTASVCIPPCYVKEARERYPGLCICTVIGFPLGYQTKETKVFETADAVKNGADEIDMVINVCDVKNGDIDKVTEEISAVRKACEGKILKVIIETCALDDEEKIKLCRCVTDGGADFIKTSTGFGSAGAQREDITLFNKHIGENVRIKAAGGIRTPKDMEDFIALGCERIGTSAAKTLFEEEGE